MTTYHEYKLNLTEGQAKKILLAGKNKESVKIRILHKNKNGDHMLLLTETQIKRINKSVKGVDLTLSYAQLKHIYKRFVDIKNESKEKTGGFLPLLALLPLLFGGIGAAGTIAGGTASIINAVKNSKSQIATQEETERHNRVIEEEVKKSGSGILSDLAGKIPLIGSTLKAVLEKIGLGLPVINKIQRSCNKIQTGECYCMGKGLFLSHQGSGLFLGDQQGNGLFLKNEGSGLVLKSQYGKGLFLE